MTRGPLSQPSGGSPRESPGTDGDVPPVVDPQPAVVEPSADAPETVSRSQTQHRVQTEQRVSAEQATYTNQQSQAEHDYDGLADTPVPSRGEDSTIGSGDASPVVDYIDQHPLRGDLLAVVKHGVVNAITFVAFLAAVSLPFLYLPLLLFGGFTPARTSGFLVLVALHAVSLVIGYRYKPRETFGGD